MTLVATRNLSLFFCIAAAACGSASSTPDAGGADASGTADATTTPDADTTADAQVDVTPPGAVGGFDADGSTAGPAVFALTWTNPSDPDLAGVLILRSDGPPATAPVAGTTYTVGEILDNAVVVSTIGGTSAQDTSAFGGHTFTYTAYAFDAAHNYGLPATDDARAEIWWSGTLSVVGGAVTVTPDVGSGGLDVSGTVTSAAGTATLSFNIKNQTDRHLFNTKFLVRMLPAGGTFTNSDGAYDGAELKYYGPQAVLMGGAATRDFTFSGVPADFDVRVELARHPMVVVSHNSGQALSLVDTGRQLIVAQPGGPDGFTGSVWFSAISADGRWVWASENYSNGVVFFDLSTLTVPQQLDIVPIAGGDPSTTIAGQPVASSDETTLYVPVSTYDGTAVHLLVVRIDIATAIETGRIDLGTNPGSNELARGMALDKGRNRLYVPGYGTSTLHVVDLTTFTQLDTDGDAANGVTPVAFGGTPHQNVSGVVVNPAGTHAYVSFGRRTNRDIAELNLTDLTTITYLPVFPSGGSESSSPNAQFAPDGRLFACRTQYPTDDVNSHGISVFDLTATPIVEQNVNILGSLATGNNDLWDVVFVPGTKLAYGSMADAGDLFPFDWTTLGPIDADGDATNGQTNIEANTSFYGGAMVVTP